MKQFKTVILLVFAAVTLCGAGVHKFYVAIFTMDYVPAKKQIQMTSRVFIDDLDKAFEIKYGRKFYIATAREIPETNEFLAKYFAEKVLVKVNGTRAKIKFLGRETEDDVLVCYYTLPVKGAVKTLEMTNTTLFEISAEQQNMVHTEVNSNKQSLLLTYDKPSGILAY